MTFIFAARNNMLSRCANAGVSTKTAYIAKRHVPSRQRSACRRQYATPVNPSSSVDHKLQLAGENSLRPGPSAAPPSQPRRQQSEVEQRQPPLERRGNPFPSSDSPSTSRSEPQPPADPETPHLPTVPRTRPHTLDARILAAARALAYAKERGSAPFAVSSLLNLLRSFEAKANTQLPICLPYEPTPDPHRRVRTEDDDDDGVLLIAYVSGLDQPQAKISVCSGFAVEGAEPLRRNGAAVGDGELLITCAHTLRACLPDAPVASTSADDAGTTSSVALALTRSGAAYPVQGLLSSLPSSDLILLQLGSTPLLPRDPSSNAPPPPQPHSDSNSLTASTSTTDVFTYAPAEAPHPPRSLPVSPYPSPVGTVLRVSSFFGWESPADATASAAALAGRRTLEAGLAEEDAEAARRRARWGRARLVEYKDRAGHEARTGTYDELSQLDFKLLRSDEDRPSADRPPPTDRSSPYARHPNAAAIAAGLNFGASADMQSHLTPENYAPLPSAAPALQDEQQLLLNFPPPGSSGGPIVEEATGAVVGVVRGCRMSQLEGRRGDAVPAEKVFEFFSLPGLGKV